ncbi:hypothetical protein [Kaistella sp.]|uniref:hypothetical protein n=1 Tax=Kaistella sp. TaxID=2782235 RepID=UPI003C44FA1F
MDFDRSPFGLKKLSLCHQLHEVQKNLQSGDYTIDDLGSILPASVMLHDMENRLPLGLEYMNNWGCEILGTSVDEINALGDAYYRKYFIKEEVLSIFKGIVDDLNTMIFLSFPPWNGKLI